MIHIPKFRLYGQDNPEIENKILPVLELRNWESLSMSDKTIILRELRNNDWVTDTSREVLATITYLNNHYLRLCPGEKLHRLHDVNVYRSMEAACSDFENLLLNEKNEAIIFRMLTKFSECFIDNNYYNFALKGTNKSRSENIKAAFQKFDRLANCLNHIFEQFSINAYMTREGIVPRQDQKIIEDIYIPVLQVLSDPKWKSVSSHLSAMFMEFQEKKYPETITNAHSAVQRFLQILVGEEGKNGQGEVGKLFHKAKDNNLIPVDIFTGPIIAVFQSFISSERATKSTAKPAQTPATSSDALLVMNVVMVLLQHCLQGNAAVK